MKYYIKRGDQEYGPYSLADLQTYLAKGEVQPTDLARSEGLEQWVPVEQIVGNIAVSQPAPSPVNYGQVPVYGSAAAGAAAPGLADEALVPPGLHWAIVLLLAIVTCGLFSMVWLFVEGAYARRLRTSSTPLLFYGIGIPLVFVSAFISAFLQQSMGRAEAAGIVGLFSLLQLAGTVLIIVGHFSMKNALEEHYNHAEQIGLDLNGVMVFFFNVLYFQYHFTRIRNWKKTGVLE